MNIIIEILNSFFAGMTVGFTTFFKVLPIYEQLNSLKEQIISSALGIPLFVISTISLLALGVRLLVKWVLK